MIYSIHKIPIIMKVTEILFFLSYGIYLIYTFLTTTFFYTYYYNEMIYKLVMLGCIGVVLFSEVTIKKCSQRELVWLLVCLALSTILLRRMMGQFSLLPFFILIYASRDIPFKKIAKFSFYLLTFLLILVVTSSYVGIIPNYLDTLIVGRNRHYLGFTYALNPAMILLNLMCLDLYLHQNKVSILRSFIWLIFSTWMYKQTSARLAFGITLITLILMFFYSHNKQFFFKHKWIGKCLTCSFVICSVTGIVITLMYNPTVTWMNSLNTVLEGRLYYGKNAIIRYGIKLFGMRIQYIGNGLNISGTRRTGEYNYVDCLYISMIQKYGILFFIIFIFMLTAAMVYLYKKKNFSLLIIMMTVAARGLIDNTFFPLHFTTFWFVLGSGLFGREKLIKSKFERKLLE